LAIHFCPATSAGRGLEFEEMLYSISSKVTDSLFQIIVLYLCYMYIKQQENVEDSMTGLSDTKQVLSMCACV